MNKRPDHITDELLARYFAGETSSAEAEQVKQWAAASSDNKEKLLQLRMLWQDTGMARIDSIGVELYDVEAALVKVKSSPRSRKRTYAPLLRIAATITILLGISWIIYQYLDQHMQSVTSQNSIKTLSLSDNTSITLNEGSSLTYPETFDVKSREVKLYGEAFFEVDHQPDRPFVVDLEHASVRVLGTSFNISSHVEKDTISVWVAAGTVGLSHQGNEIILEAGQKGYFVKSLQKLIREDQINTSGADQFWRTQRLIFTGQKLAEVIRSINLAYHSNIQLTSESLENCSLAVTFENEPLDNILEVISLTFNLEVTHEQGIIKISGEGCTND